MTTGDIAEVSPAADAPVSRHATGISMLCKLLPFVPEPRLLGALLGPIAGLALWWLPLGLGPTVQTALAVVAFMLVYWIVEPIDYGMTALIGCYLFWALQVTTFSAAFSGFANATPWFIFGVLLLGEAASQTGLARRIGFLVVQRMGTSYARLLLGVIRLVWLMSFLIPSPIALVTTLAPVALGILAVFGAERGSNLGRGLFVILAYVATVFGKMILGGGVTVLARGIIETQTGLQVLWSQWLLAFLPCALLTIVAAWLTVRWLYPVDSDVLPGGRQSLRETLQAMGPWSTEERKALAALLLAIGLWATDFLHRLNPAVIAIGCGLLLTRPKVGVLDTKALKSVNFLLVVFVGGALSMGTVLAETEVLDLVMGRLLAWLGPLLREAWQASVILYWSNVLYHFLLGNELTMISISLPVMLKVAQDNGYNAAAMGMIWAFAGGGKLFAYQASGLVVGYSYGYFAAKDLVKVGAILTLVEGAILMALVPLYWPLIGLPWQVTPAAQVAVSTDHEMAQAPPVPRQPAPQAAEGAIIQQVQAHLTELSLDPSPTDSQHRPSAEAVSSQVQATSAVPSTRRLD